MPHLTNPTESSRKKIQPLLRKKGYKTTPVVSVGKSSQYWIIYTEDKENKERRFKNAEWSLY